MKDVRLHAAASRAETVTTLANWALRVLYGLIFLGACDQAGGRIDAGEAATLAIVVVAALLIEVGFALAKLFVRLAFVWNGEISASQPPASPKPTRPSTTQPG